MDDVNLKLANGDLKVIKALIDDWLARERPPSAESVKEVGRCLRNIEAALQKTQPVDVEGLKKEAEDWFWLYSNTTDNIIELINKYIDHLIQQGHLTPRIPERYDEEKTALIGALSWCIGHLEVLGVNVGHPKSVLDGVLPQPPEDEGKLTKINDKPLEL